MKPVKTFFMGFAAAVMVFSIPALPSVAQDLGKGMASGGWTATDNMEHPRYDHTATLLNNGKVLIAVGYDSPRNAEIYDPDTGLFTQTDSLLVEHTFHSATLLPDGRVLIVAGQHPDGPETHTVAEIFDPQSGTFTLTDSLEEARSAHTATLLPDGRVLIAGGIHTTSPSIGYNLNSCEMYDPSTGLFTTTSGMEKPRAEHTSTLLPNGKVLIAGGAWSDPFSELFDPASDSWSRTGDMTVGHRSNHTATLLPHGHVLLAGGFVESSSSSVELYDPNTNAFSQADSMITPRSQHTATRLSDGRILVTGKYGNYALDLTELFWVDSLTVVNQDGRNDGNVPESFTLSQNYPNPFNPETTIRYSLSVSGFATLGIYDLNGKMIKVLFQDHQDKASMKFNGVERTKRSTKSLPESTIIALNQAKEQQPKNLYLSNRSDQNTSSGY